MTECLFQGTFPSSCHSASIDWGKHCGVASCGSQMMRLAISLKKAGFLLVFKKKIMFQHEKLAFKKSQPVKSSLFRVTVTQN